jgi:hypothetical protein
MISLRARGGSARGAVVDDRGLAPGEGDAAEPCDQGFGHAALEEACAHGARGDVHAVADAGE